LIAPPSIVTRTGEAFLSGRGCKRDVPATRFFVMRP
jgi:hypothetical protein